MDEETKKKEVAITLLYTNTLIKMLRLAPIIVHMNSDIQRLENYKGTQKCIQVQNDKRCITLIIQYNNKQVSFGKFTITPRQKPKEKKV